MTTQVITPDELTSRVREFITSEYPHPQEEISPSLVKTELKKRYGVDCSDIELLRALLALGGIELKIELTTHAFFPITLRTPRCFKFVRIWV